MELNLVLLCSPRGLFSTGQTECRRFQFEPSLSSESELELELEEELEEPLEEERDVDLCLLLDFFDFFDFFDLTDFLVKETILKFE